MEDNPNHFFADRVARIQRAVLYGILDMGYVSPDAMMSVAEGLLAGGAGVLQLRAKGYEAGEVCNLVEKHAAGLDGLCRRYGVPLIVNDYPELAVELGADGVHIGQDDGSLVDVRERVGDDMLVGRSTHSVKQARAALDEGFDYIGFGPLFLTPTKQGRPGIGLDQVETVQREIGGRIPVFCIGGIKPENLELVLASGARRVVIVSALLQAQDIQAATRDVLAELKPEH